MCAGNERARDDAKNLEEEEPAGPPREQRTIIVMIFLGFFIFWNIYFP